MPAGSTYEPIATTTLGSSQSNVTFSSITGSYTDLVLIIAGPSSTYDGLLMQVGNGSVDTGSNYSVTLIYGSGSVAGSIRESNGTLINIGLHEANFNIIINCMNYANTNTYKTFIARSNAPANGVRANVGLWRSTSAVNTIKIMTGSGTFSSGCVFTLYGIAAA